MRDAGLAARAAVAAVIALVASGCGGQPDPALAGLRADPLADAAFPGTASGSTRTTSSGTALGQPRHASLLRTLPLTGGAMPASVAAGAVAAARAAGWTMDGHLTATNLGDTGTKATGSRRMSVAVAVDDRRLTVLLTDSG